MEEIRLTFTEKYEKEFKKLQITSRHLVSWELERRNILSVGWC